VLGSVIIKKVHLKNFISHKESEVIFERGVTALVGPNGAGKSSILDAIYFALTGKARRGRLEDLVNAAASRGAEAVVKLWLDVGGREVVIERRVSRSGKHDAVLRMDGKTVLRVSNVNKEIEELLGLKAESLQTVAIIPQGALTELITLKPASRLEILDELLNLNTFETAWEKLKDYKVSVKTKKVPPQTYQPTKQSLDNLKEFYSRVVADIRGKEQDLTRLADAQSRLRKELQEVGNKVSKLRSDIEVLEEKKKELEAKKHELIGVEEELRNIMSEVNARRKRLSELSREVAKLRDLEVEVGKLSELSKQQHKLRELLLIDENLHNKKTMLDSKKGELGRAEELLTELKSILGRYPEGIEERIRRLELVRSKLSKAREELSKLTENLGRLKSDQANLERLIGRLLDEVGTVLNETLTLLGSKFNSVADSLSAAKRRAGELRESIRELQVVIQEKLSQASIEKGRAAEAREKLRVLMRGSQGRCPLCGQSLTHERREFLIEKLDNDVRTRKERAERLESEAEELSKKASRMEDELKKLEDLIVKLESAKLREDELRELKEKLAKVSNEVRSVEDRITVLKNEISRLEKEESELMHIEKDKARIEAIIAQGVNDEQVSRLRREVRKLEEEVEGLLARHKELRCELSRFFGEDFDIGEAMSMAEEASERAKEMREVIGRLKQSAAELERLEEEVKNYLSRASLLENKRSELLPKVRELEGINARLSMLRQDLEDLVRKEGELRSRLSEVEVRFSEISDEVKALRDDAEILRTTWCKLSVLRWVREEILHRDKAPAIIRKVSLAKIEALMKKYIELFNISYSDVRVDEKFNITLVSPYLEADINRLSGGEVVVTAIAALLALHNIVSGGRLGFLILDEPTIHLDEDKRRQLIDVLKEFRGGGVIPQLIVVTHHDEVKEAADLVYEVSKNTFSKVREVSSIEL